MLGLIFVAWNCSSRLVSSAPALFAMTMPLPPDATSAVRDWLVSREFSTFWTVPLDATAAMDGLLALNSKTADAPGDVDRVDGVQALTTMVPAVPTTDVALWSRTCGVYVPAAAPAGAVNVKMPLTKVTEEACTQPAPRL